MKVTATLVGSSVFQYNKDGASHTAGTAYFTYSDPQVNGLKTGSMFVGGQDPDFSVLTDPKNNGKKMELLSTWNGNTKKTNFFFVNLI